VMATRYSLFLISVVTPPLTPAPKVAVRLHKV
jgi:hypothetical protein